MKDDTKQAAPSDADILSIASAVGICSTSLADTYSSHKDNLIDFARALLARYAGSVQGPTAWRKAIDGLIDFRPDSGFPSGGMIRGGEYVRKADVIEALSSITAPAQAEQPDASVEPVRFNWNEHLVEHNALQYQHDFDLFKVVEAFVGKHVAAQPAQDERGAFEQWAQSKQLSCVIGTWGGYAFSDTARAWDAWQASRAALSTQASSKDAGESLRLPSDQEIQAFWDKACQDSPSAPGWNRHIRFARALLDNYGNPYLTVTGVNADALREKCLDDKRAAGGDQV